MLNIGNAMKEAEAYIIEMRRWFHQHPDLPLKEEKTAQKIKQELDSIGIPYEELPPNCGLVATIQGKAGEKVIAARADIDALPVTEESDVPFVSQNEGVMHACGHDAHIAMLLGAAKVLNEHKDQFSGTVKLVFQAAEEVGLGVEEVLEYFEKTGGVDQIIGLHIWSTIPEGEILLHPGAVFAGGRSFECNIHGQGGHGGRPDLANDPIKTACELVQKFASIPSNLYDVMDHSVVSTGTIQGGTIYNAIPSEAKIGGSIRYFKKGGDALIAEKMRRIAKGVGEMYNTEVELKISESHVIPVYNQPDLIQRARALVSEVEGLEVSAQTDPVCAGDDFCFLLDKYPGFFGILGAGSKTGESYPQHHPKFTLDEASFRKGSELMVRYILDYLQ